MCRSIKTLYNYEPPATEEEIRAAALQFVRKISGFHHPSQVNQPVFDQAVSQVAAVAHQLLGSLQTHAKARTKLPPRAAVNGGGMAPIVGSSPAARERRRPPT